MISQKVFKPEIPGQFNVSARQILLWQHIINEDEDVRSKGVKNKRRGNSITWCTGNAKDLFSYTNAGSIFQACKNIVVTVMWDAVKA